MMNCIHCGNEIEIETSSTTSSIEYHGYYCQCCLVYYTMCKDSDKEWYIVKPECSKCSSLLELDEVLKDGTAVFICPECGEVLILEPVGKK